tara:strand:+ start:147 stop:386 length:240 start_codon:yes stop_codon:yes gene_type:complete
MPSIDITQQLYDYLKNNLVDESIDVTIRMLINMHDLPVEQFGIDDEMDNQSEDSDTNDVSQDNTAVGGKGDSTNSGYIR